MRHPTPGSTWDPRRIIDQRGAIVGKRAARVIRSSYARRIRAGRLPPIEPERSVPVDVVTFSCERDLPEQILSLRSFLRYVGEPASCTVVSDGTITARSAAALRSTSPVVCVREVEDYAAGLAVPEPVRRFADAKVYGRKLITLLAMRPSGRPVLYSDADVLYHRGGRGLAALLAENPHTNYFLQDCQEALDVRLVPPEERTPPLNSGLLVAGAPIDWSQAARRLGGIGEADAAGYGWTEQSVAHLAYRDSGGRPLPARRCVVALHDRYQWSDSHVGEGTWLRHYVTGTRFKMWLCLLGAVQA